MKIYSRSLIKFYIQITLTYPNFIFNLYSHVHEISLSHGLFKFYMYIFFIIFTKCPEVSDYMYIFFTFMNRAEMVNHKIKSYSQPLTLLIH